MYTIKTLYHYTRIISTKYHDTANTEDWLSLTQSLLK